MKNLLITLLGVFLMSGCATIVDLTKGNSQNIYFTTPTGKNVVAVFDGQKVTIPAVVKVDKSKDITISVYTNDNPKYQNYSALLSSLTSKEYSPAWWANISGSILSTSGSLTDNFTGSTYQYSQPVIILPLNEK